MNSWSGSGEVETWTVVFISQDVLLLHVAQSPQPWWWLSSGERMISCSIPKWTCQYISFSSSWLMKINQPDQPVPGFWMVLDGFGIWLPLGNSSKKSWSPSQLRCCCGLSRVPHSHARDAQGMPRGETAKLSRGCLELPSGYVKIAIKNGHRNSGFTMIYPLNMVMFHSFFCMFTRVYSVMAGLGRVRVFFLRGSQCGFLRQESERFFPAGLSIQIVPDRFAIHQAQDFSLAGRYSWRRTCAKWRRDQRSGLDGLRPSKDNICGYLVDFRSVNWIWLIPVAISTLELVNLCIV